MRKFHWIGNDFNGEDGMCYSENGKLLALASGNCLSVINVSTGQRIAGATFRGFGKVVDVFLIDTNGLHFYVAWTRGVLQLFDFMDGVELQRWFLGFGMARAVPLSGLSGALAVLLWLRDGPPPAVASAFPGGPAGDGGALAAAVAAAAAASGSADAEGLDVHLLLRVSPSSSPSSPAAPSAQSAAAALLRARVPLVHLSACACGRPWVAAAPAGADFGVWAGDSGRLVGAAPAGQRAALTALAWAGPLLACGGADGAVAVWELPGGGAPARPRQRLKWHAAAVRALCGAADARHLLSAGREDALVLWDLRTQRRAFAPRLGVALRRLALAPGGAAAAAAAADGSLQLFDVAAARRVRALCGARRAPHGSPLPLLPDPQRARLLLLHGPQRRELQLLDAAAGRARGAVAVAAANANAALREAQTEFVCAAALSPDGALLAAASRAPRAPESTLLIYGRANHGEEASEIVRVERAHGRGEIVAAAWRPLPQGAAARAAPPELLTVCHQRRVKLWAFDDERKAWRCAAAARLRGPAPASAACWTPDGSMAAVAVGFEVALWAPDDGRMLGTLAAAGGANAPIAQLLAPPAAPGLLVARLGAPRLGLLVLDVLRGQAEAPPLLPGLQVNDAACHPTEPVLFAAVEGEGVLVVDLSPYVASASAAAAAAADVAAAADAAADADADAGNAPNAAAEPRVLAPVRAVRVAVACDGQELYCINCDGRVAGVPLPPALRRDWTALPLAPERPVPLTAEAEADAATDAAAAAAAAAADESADEAAEKARLAEASNALHWTQRVLSGLLEDGYAKANGAAAAAATAEGGEGEMDVEGENSDADADADANADVDGDDDEMMEFAEENAGEAVASVQQLEEIFKGPTHLLPSAMVLLERFLKVTEVPDPEGDDGELAEGDDKDDEDSEDEQDLLSGAGAEFFWVHKRDPPSMAAEAEDNDIDDGDSDEEEEDEDDDEPQGFDYDLDDDAEFDESLLEQEFSESGDSFAKIYSKDPEELIQEFLKQLEEVQ